MEGRKLIHVGKSEAEKEAVLDSCWGCKKKLSWDDKEGIRMHMCEENAAWRVHPVASDLTHWTNKVVAHCTQCVGVYVCKECSDSGRLPAIPCKFPLYGSAYGHAIRCWECKKVRQEGERGHFATDSTVPARCWWCDACAPRHKDTKEEGQ